MGNAWVKSFVKSFNLTGHYSSQGKYTYWDHMNGLLHFIHMFGYEYCRVGVEAYFDERISFDYLADTYFKRKARDRTAALLAYFASEEDRL